MRRRLHIQVERAAVLLIIILAVLDFLTILPVFWAYCMDVMAWTLIAYILYAVSPTELLFGTRHAHADLIVVLAYVVMSVKDYIGSAAATIPQLIQEAPSYITIQPTNATEGVVMALTQHEFAAITVNGTTDAVAQYMARYLSTSVQQLSVILTDGTKQAAYSITPTGLEGSLLLFYNTVRSHAAQLEYWSLIIGTVLLLGVSVYAALRIPVQRPSVLSVVKEEGRPTAMRILWVFLCLVGLFVMVFNLLFEWMTVTDDAPLLVLALIVLLVVYLLKHRLRHNLFQHVAELTEDFYIKAIRLFMNGKTILLGISGFLVLHLITDVGNYIAPAIFGWYQTMYTVSTPGSHATLYQMLSLSVGQGPARDGAVVLIYLLSTAGMVLLLSVPAVMWYSVFRLRHGPHHPDWKGWQVGLALAAMSVAITVPVFRFSTLRSSEFVGVNLISNPVIGPLADAVPAALLVAFILFIFCVAVSRGSDHARRVIMLGPFSVAIIFFGIYIYNYFVSTYGYYARLLADLVSAGRFAALPMLFAIFGLTILFFVTGFCAFLYELWRE